MSTQKFKVNETVFIPQFKENGVITKLDENGLPELIAIGDTIIKASTLVIEKISLIQQILRLIKSLFKKQS